MAGEYSIKVRTGEGRKEIYVLICSYSHSNGVKIMHKAALARMVNEVQLKANMTVECALTRSLVADLLDTISKAHLAVPTDSPINLLEMLFTVNES